MPATLAIDRRRSRLVAGEHHDVQAERVETADRVHRRRLDRIGDRHESGELAVDSDEHDGLRLAIQPVRVGRERRRIDAAVRPSSRRSRRSRRGRRSRPSCRGP